MKSLVACVAAAAGSHSISAFTFSPKNNINYIPSSSSSSTSTPTRASLSASLRKIMSYSSTKLYEQKQDQDQEDERSGMEKAFLNLDDLSSLDMGTPAKSSESKLFNNLDDISIDIESTLKEQEEKGEMSLDELNLYKEMYDEVEQKGGDDTSSIYDDILGEMTIPEETPTSTSTTQTVKSSAGKGFGVSSSSSSSKSKSISPLVDADGIGAINANDDEEQLTAVELSQDTDEFMRRALEEALSDTSANLPEGLTTKDKAAIVDNIDADSILEDEELMKEINAIFDRANDQLIAGVSDIKAEQNALSQASAAGRDQSIDYEEKRLKDAEGSVSRLVDKVKRETLEVEKAVNDLKAVQEDMGGDPLSKAVDLKKAGVVKQSAVVGAMLFSFRTAGELLFVAQGVDVEGHGASAAIQGLIALACGAYLLFF